MHHWPQIIGYEPKRMPNSWNYKLFLRINAQIGKRPWLDTLFIFVATWGIAIHVILFLFVGYRGALDASHFFWTKDFLAWLSWTAASLVITLAINYLIALLWRHRRPQMEFPNVRLLIKTLGTWKSFPSDHTSIAFLLAFAATPFFFAAPVFVSLLYVTATSVAVSRVRVGVHFPRDIIGGVITAGIGYWAIPAFHFAIFGIF